MVSEFHSTVRSCTESEEDAKLPLFLHLPMKNPQDYYCLRDIVANGQALDGKVINILAGVRSEPSEGITYALCQPSGYLAPGNPFLVKHVSHSLDWQEASSL
ncbi:MEIOB protein, partial [Polypterus senegalus]